MLVKYRERVKFVSWEVQRESWRNAEKWLTDQKAKGSRREAKRSYLK